MPHTNGQYPAAGQFPTPGQQHVSLPLGSGMLPVHGVNFGQAAASFRGDAPVPPQRFSAASGTSFSQLVVADPRTAMISGSGLGLLSPEEAESMEEGPGAGPAAWALAMNIVFGDLFHNFFDGVIIATGFRVCGHQMGWTLTAASIVHEIPQEISDFVILIQCGLCVPPPISSPPLPLPPPCPDARCNLSVMVSLRGCVV
eukprot:3933935-Rhodomonas_salina.4